MPQPVIAAHPGCGDTCVTDADTSAPAISEIVVRAGIRRVEFADGPDSANNRGLYPVGCLRDIEAGHVAQFL